MHDRGRHADDPVISTGLTCRLQGTCTVLRCGALRAAVLHPVLAARADTSCLADAPFGQSPPSATGLAGTPGLVDVTVVEGRSSFLRVDGRGRG